MPNAQKTVIHLPFPSRWGINAYAGGRPVIWGTLIITSVANNRVTGTVNFRGTPLPIQGTWDEGSRQIRFDSPYARFSGRLSLFDDRTIRIRHFTLQGDLMMKPPSLQAGEYGTWIATTDICLSQLPPGTASSPSSSELPPVGVFVTSDYQGKICP
ncbi:hypothetical protein O9H85_18740 [Paenibacillus filicis]|uniref:Uncharacterized protein n=1 Tax=Paenibacillus gyeongsangnamensis TaxID=3388067 RepID=A0ABT4QC76_9BACL|nr:hypothetical protein [Paenibacillus filicis]MCZ8514423.1 hypothetical protein [Paenibacillus filicis]